MTKLCMTTLDEWHDNLKRDQYLASQLKADRLALILGAGISKAFNLPDWGELIKSLFDAKGEAVPDKDAKRQVEYLRNKYYPNNELEFIKAVKEALYRKVNVSYEVLRRCDTLAAIASLAMASRRGSASNLITFNWDNLLEKFLQYHGFITESIFCDRHWSTAADVTVFHPHGYLPFGSEKEQSRSIVFDQRSYTSIMGSEGRLWKETLVSIMRCRTCVLIGLSGNDDNLDMLLRECQEHHASLNEKTAFWAVTFTTATEEADLLFWKSRKIYPVTVSDYQRDLPEALFRIPQIAASL